MGASKEQDPAVQSLLKLKRYERPPEPYFHRLNGDVMGRLKGPEGARRTSLFSLLDVEFGIKPTLFYGLGAAFCALACYGLAHLAVRNPDTVAAEASALLLAPAADTASPPLGEIAATPATVGSMDGAAVSTSVVLHAGQSAARLPIVRVSGSQ